MSYYENRIKELEARIAEMAREARLKSITVERQLIEHAAKLKTENNLLKDEVERLRNAGDAMERSLAFTYPDSPKIKDWNSAKEGKNP